MPAAIFELKKDKIPNKLQSTRLQGQMGTLHSWILSQSDLTVSHHFASKPTSIDSIYSNVFSFGYSSSQFFSHLFIDPFVQFFCFPCSFLSSIPKCAQISQVIPNHIFTFSLLSLHFEKRNFLSAFK